MPPLRPTANRPGHTSTQGADVSHRRVAAAEAQPRRAEVRSAVAAPVSPPAHRAVARRGTRLGPGAPPAAPLPHRSPATLHRLRRPPAAVPVRRIAAPAAPPAVARAPGPWDRFPAPAQGLAHFGTPPVLAQQPATLRPGGELRRLWRAPCYTPAPAESTHGRFASHTRRWSPSTRDDA